VVKNKKFTSSLQSKCQNFLKCKERSSRMSHWHSTRIWWTL